MDARDHSIVWRTAGNDLGHIAERTKTHDRATGQLLGALALLATIVGTAYHKKAQEEANAGPKV